MLPKSYYLSTKSRLEKQKTNSSTFLLDKTNASISGKPRGKKINGGSSFIGAHKTTEKLEDSKSKKLCSGGSRMRTNSTYIVSKESKTKKNVCDKDQSSSRNRKGPFGTANDHLPISMNKADKKSKKKSKTINRKPLAENEATNKKQRLSDLPNQQDNTESSAHSAKKIPQKSKTVSFRDSLEKLDGQISEKISSLQSKCNTIDMLKFTIKTQLSKEVMQSPDLHADTLFHASDPNCQQNLIESLEKLKEVEINFYVQKIGSLQQQIKAIRQQATNQEIKYKQEFERQHQSSIAENKRLLEQNTLLLRENKALGALLQKRPVSKSKKAGYHDISQPSNGPSISEESTILTFC